MQHRQPLASSYSAPAFALASGLAADAALPEQLAVDPHFAELVDDHGQAPPVGVGEQMPEQRGLPAAQKPGDDRGRKLVHGVLKTRYLVGRGSRPGRDA